MGRLDEERSDLDIARREESKAYNELEHCERQAQEQQSQLDDLLQNREGCIDGLKMAKKTGLTPVHVREFQLLMTHIDSIVETIQHKVDVSQEKCEKAKEVWQEKNEKYAEVKEMMEQALIPDDQTKSEEEEDSKGAGSSSVDKEFYEDDFYGDRIISVQSK